jgi:hypothetical protein
MARRSMMKSMSEHELATQLQGSKDDVSEWGEPEALPTDARREKRRLAAMVSVRLAPEELAALQGHVRGLDLTVSGFLRRLALEQIDRSKGTPDGPCFRLVDASVGVQSFRTTSPFVHAQVVTHKPIPA